MDKFVKNTIRLPKVSDMGAWMSGPIPSMQTKPACAPRTAFWDVWNSEAISLLAGASMDDAMGQTNAIMKIWSVCMYFHFNGQFFGSSGSSSANSTFCFLFWSSRSELWFCNNGLRSLLAYRGMALRYAICSRPVGAANRIQRCSRGAKISRSYAI